jgi:hypothetical protein
LSCAKREEVLRFQWFIIFLPLSTFSEFVQSSGLHHVPRSLLFP